MTPSDDSTALPATDARPKMIARRAMRRCWLLTGAMIAATGLGLASCVPPAPEPIPAPAPTPTPTPTPAPVVTAPTDWMDAPLTLGDWQYVGGATATRALFGPTASGTLFTVACEPANRQVKLWRAANVPAATTMTITTTESVRTLPVQHSGGQAVATLAPYDPILDAMIFTRGRLAVQIDGAPTIYVPSWPEIARVVEDCR